MRFTTLTLILTIFLICKLSAQVEVRGFSDFGHSNVSENLFLKASGQIDYRLNKYKIGTTFQTNIISENSNLLSAWNLNLSRDIIIKSYNFNAKAFFIWAPYNNTVRETNYGILLQKDFKQFNINLGTSFKTIYYSKYAIEQYNLTYASSLHENFNLIYNFSYNLNRSTAPWNVAISLTNIDHFVVNQATNPMTNINGIYKINNKLQVFAELLYITAGAFNLHVNYFGLHFRPGIIWKIQ